MQICICTSYANSKNTSTTLSFLALSTSWTTAVVNVYIHHECQDFFRTYYVHYVKKWVINQAFKSWFWRNVKKRNKFILYVTMLPCLGMLEELTCLRSCSLTIHHFSTLHFLCCRPVGTYGSGWDSSQPSFCSWGVGGRLWPPYRDVPTKF